MLVTALWWDFPLSPSPSEMATSEFVSQRQNVHKFVKGVGY